MSVRFNTWIENLDRNQLNYDYLMCTTEYEIQTKYPDVLPGAVVQLSRLPLKSDGITSSTIPNSFIL